MINLLLLLVFLTCAGMVAAWVAENPGSVTIHWFDYRIDTSFAFLLLLALLAAFIVAYAWILIRGTMKLPSRFSHRRNLKHFQKGLHELTWSVASLAAADIKSAAEHTRKAEKLLGTTPLTLLLSAQIAKSQGDDAKTRILLEQMLEHEETEYLAARSLSDAASKQQMLPKALALAERAQAINPRGIIPIISLHIKLGQWQEALIAIRKAAWKRHITRAQMHRYRGIVYFEQGMQLLETDQKEAALLAAKLSFRELPEFSPVIAFAAKAYDANGKSRKAIALRKTLVPENGWICSDCHHSVAEWAAHCSSCGAFDTLETKQS